MIAQSPHVSNPEAPQGQGFKVSELPENWRFCKIRKGQKGPTYGNWQNTPYSFQDVAKSPNYGVLLGTKSGGLVALDVDGSSAQQLLESWGAIPPTAIVTSGWSPDRRAYFFTVPPEYWEALATTSIATGAESQGWDGKTKAEELEIRWTGGQQVIHGTHPSGSTYHWLTDPTTIAPLPHHILEKWLETLTPAIAPTPRPQQAPLDLPITLNLIDFVSKDTRAHLEQGTSDGGRNSTGHKLYSDLYGAECWLSTQGVSFSGEADQMFMAWCQAVGLDQDKPKNQPVSIMRSVEKKGPAPSTPVGTLEKRLKWLTKPEEERTRQQQRYSPKPQAPKPAPPQPPEIDIHSVIEEANTWANLCQQRLSPHILFPPALAQPIADAAHALNIGAEGIIAPLLAITGSLIGATNRIEPKPGWQVGPTLWTAVVARSGQFKSPALNAVLRPLITLDTDAGENHRLAMEAWEKDLAAWEELRRNGGTSEPKPQPPQRRHFYSGEATLEALLQVHCDGPNQRGLIFAKHELAGLVLGMDQYKGGRGNDRQNWLELADGSPVKRITKAQTLAMPQSNLCVTGGIQPSVLDRIAEGSDSDGLWARFLWFSLPLIPPEWIEAPYHLGEVLHRLYYRLSGVAQNQTFYLTPEAKAKFIDQWIEWRNLALTTPDGVNNAYSKASNQALAVALNLHAIAWALGDTPTPPCDLEPWAIQGAIALVNYSLSQVLRRSEDTTIDLNPTQRKLIELSQASTLTDGWIKSKEICQRFRNPDGSKMSTNDARALIATLMELGIGETMEGARSSMLWRFATGTSPANYEKFSVDNSYFGRQIVDNLSTDESQTGSGFQEFGRQIDKIDKTQILSTENSQTEIIDDLSICLPNSQNPDRERDSSVDNLSTDCLPKPVLSTETPKATVTVTWQVNPPERLLGIPLEILGEDEDTGFLLVRPQGTTEDPCLAAPSWLGTQSTPPAPLAVGDRVRFVGSSPPNIKGLDDMTIAKIDGQTATVSSPAWAVKKQFSLSDLSR